MKNFRILMLMAAMCCVSAICAVAQRSSVYGPQVLKMQSGPHDYVPNQVIVKFKDASGVEVKCTSKRKIKTTSVQSLDNKLASLGISEAEQLMPLTGAKKLRRSNAPLRSYSGRIVEEPDMSRLYLMNVDSTKNTSVYEVIEQLESMDEVEYAEPNYRVYALATDSTTYVAEPLYSQQWGLEAINMPALWDMPKVNDKRPVIAILDTGVDIEHPDLSDNIWTNEAELNGVEGVDDDGNGFVDDICGWDFINQNGNMNDYNGHGTHCAGIAAAVGNNGIGITGANPDALIMPVSILQSNGTGDVATIIKGLDYATHNGAEVISMSFGSYATSFAYELALGKAYQKAILVAAAGNDYLCIYTHDCDINKKTEEFNKPCFPAAYSFVLGVQASDGGKLATFSNYDEDGSLFSTYPVEKGYNYELIAPGVGIMSTYPGGQYKSLNGTSMACPLVAGAISRLIQCKEYLSKELLWGDLIHASSFNLDIYGAYLIDESDRKPSLAIVSNGMDDTELGDGDWRADAGETIHFYPTIKNQWGEAVNVKVSIEMGEFEDETMIEFITSEVALGSNLSSYAHAQVSTPIVIKVNPDCVDGRIIKLRMRATCDNVKEDFVQDFEIKVENGVELTRIITSDMTLYPNVHYIVTHGCYVAPDVTLTIMPGTIIKIKEDAIFRVDPTAKLICVGTPEQPITFTKTDLDVWGGEIVMPAYYEFGNHIYNQKVEYTIFKYIYTNANSSIDCFDCLFEDCILDNPSLNPVRTNIINNNAENGIAFFDSTSACNFIENDIETNFAIPGSNTFSNHSDYYGVESCSAKCIGDFALIKHDRPSYLGTASEDVVKNYILDMYHPNSPATNFMVFDYSNMLKEPVAEAHGIVWKVVVNGYDTQDEYELLPPLGVGKHKFEVYFNRPMNKAIEPMVAMGVRPPYTQNAIAEDGSWNEEGTIYTAYLTITGKSATDGINRIYVAGAQDDEYFDIPVERQRFNVNVQATGSLSTGLMAEAGLGKVHLTWETDEEDFEDLLGYNIIRYTEHADSIYETDFDKYGDWELHLIIKGDTTLINETLIDSREQEFTDYNVVPGTTYYYQIKQMTTSLTSHDLSNVVAATPLTASKGDANGSMSVDVADVVTEVAYMTYQDPQPFIFEAADVITDSVINVLDVVGTVNIIKNPTSVSASSVGSSAVYTIEDGILYVDSDVALGGVQFRFNVGEGDEIIPLEALDGFETVSDDQGDNGYLFFAFSMSGKVLPIGKHALLQIGNAEITEVVLSDATGKNVVAIDGKATGLGTIEALQMVLPYPNPFDEVLTVPYKIGKDGRHDVKIVVSTIAGSRVAEHNVSAEYGEYSWNWYAGESVQAGVYFVSLYVDDKLMQTAKVVKK